MEEKEREQRFERRVRFVARHYQPGALDAERAWRRFALAHGIRQVSTFRRYWMATAAAVLLLLGIGGWWLVGRSAPDWVAIATAAGETRDVYLPDSTLVALAGGSSLRYDRKDYGKERRTVEMRGKAFFQVTRNEARPFSIRSARTEVTVLGTSFLVDERAKDTRLDVMTGRVRFAAAEGEAKPVILTAGMSARYATGGDSITVSDKPAENRMAWRDGVLRFRETPLRQVIADLSDTFRTTVVNRAGDNDSRLTATFRGESLEEILRIINQTLDVRLEVENK